MAKQSHTGNGAAQQDHDDAKQHAADAKKYAEAAAKAAKSLQGKAVTDPQLQRAFETVPLSDEQTEQIHLIRKAGAGMAQTIVDNVPNGPGRQHAVRIVQMAMHAAADAVRMRGQ